MAKLREQTHIGLVELHSKVERLSEGTHCMGETLQARAESVHTELLRLQEAAQARPPLPVKVSSLVAQFRSFQERQAQFEKHMEDIVAQQVSQLHTEMSPLPPSHVVQELVSRMESQAKEIRHLRQCLSAPAQGKMSVQQNGCPPPHLPFPV